jgi:2-polyprenyl-3-methyl-5-hydroxy-6-metoxy-1,4-benzoquinol methylase
MEKIDDWYLKNLICPKSKTALSYTNNQLISKAGNIYPVIEGIPVMLLDDVNQTIELATNSISAAQSNSVDRLQINTLGVTDGEKEQLRQYIDRQQEAQIESQVDPVVQFLVAATNGILYKEAITNLGEYPIPELRLPDSDGKLLLDVGCSWGRWCVAAARKNYNVVGIDPSLGAVLAAKRVTNQLGLNIRFVVGDARYLPFKAETFDQVFSYSVLQHFSKPDAKTALAAIKNVLKLGGKSLIQMPNSIGIRSLQHQINRGFSEGADFDVRYWSVRELSNSFNDSIGNSTIEVDGFFGLGIQKSDIKIMPNKYKMVIISSELLRGISTEVLNVKTHTS